jgi:hypothetical protein
LAFVVVLSLGVTMIAMAQASPAGTFDAFELLKTRANDNMLLVGGPGICSNDKTIACTTIADCGAGNTCYIPTAGGELLHNQVCMDDANPKDKLNCNANDISITNTHNTIIVDPCDGTVGDTATISFVAEFNLTAQDRYDIGVWISEDGGNALTGECSVADFPISPTPPWTNLDTADQPTDTCGDISSSNNPLFSSIQNIEVACVDNNGDGFADINACLSWRQPGNNNTCTSPLKAFPGAPSKCNCQLLPGIEIPVRGKITVIKHVINDNGGINVAGDFTMSLNDTGNTTFPGAESPGTTNTFDAGYQYNVSESSLSGYTDSYSGDCTGAIVANVTKTCTVTNDDIAPQLHLRKVVTNDNGGTKTVADFTLTADGTGSNDLSGTSPVDSGPTLQADTWALSETVVPGYSNAGWVCDGGTQNGSNITVGIGGSATCTITNDDQTAHLKLVKVVVNDNGGTKVASDWTLTATGAKTYSGAGGFDLDVDPGTYALSESTISGYTNGGFDCGASVTLALGESKTCTITNNDIAPKLTLVKTVVNDNGGNLTKVDFPSFVDGTAQAWDVATEVTANVQHTASETPHAGYTPSVWGGDCAADGKITLLPGDNKTCTITNDDIAPKLTLVKTVVNDNGGNLTKVDFPSFVDGTAQAWDVATEVTANVQHTASETPHAGYTPSVWGGDCAADGKITLLPGDNKTCTITNDDIAPQLIVIKHVINDNGGTSTAANFTLDSGGINDTPDDFAGAESPGTTVTLDAGAYNVTESGPAGYSASYSADCTGTAVIGQTKSCTVTNDDIPQTGVLLPTQTTCEMYRDGPWPPMYEAFMYGVKGGKINSISPGVIFYYNTVTVLATGDIAIMQSNTQGWPTMLVHTSLSQAKLYNMNCNVLTQYPANYGSNNDVVNFSNVTAGTYIIGIKYSPASLIGKAVTLPYPTSIYTWDTVGYTGSLASIPVKPR